MDACANRRAWPRWVAAWLVLAVAVCLGDRFVPPRPPEAPWIRMGMTAGEVAAVLGGRPGDYREGHRGEAVEMANDGEFPGMLECWLWDDRSVIVWFDNSSRVKRVAFSGFGDP